MLDISIKSMYHLAPLIKLPETIDLPATSGTNSMYRLEPLIQIRGFSSHQAGLNGVFNDLDSNSCDVVQQLSARQEAVMQKLQRLQQQLDQLKAKQMQNRKNVPASVSSVVTGVPQFQVLSSLQQAVVAGLNELREHVVVMLKHQRTQAPDRNMDFSNYEDKNLEGTQQHVHNKQLQLLERLQSLRSQIIATSSSQALEEDDSSSQLAKRLPGNEKLFTLMSGFELNGSDFNPEATTVGCVTAVSCKQDVSGAGSAVNSSLLGSQEDVGVREQSYCDIAETHATLLAILYKLREQVLQLPLLVHNATNTATAATATPAMLDQQHHAVLHKLLLLQHRLSDVLLKQPGCPTWPPSGSEAGVCHDLVISASPLSPPYSVLAMATALRAVGYTVLTTSAIHSSIDHNTVPLALSSEFSSSSTGSSSRGDHHQVVLSFVWSAVPRVTLMVNPLAQCSISGEGNVLRYLSRLLPASSPYHYEGDASFAAIARTDLALDDCTTLLAAAATDKRAIGQFVKRMDEALKKTSAGVAEPVFGSVGDVAVWSALRQLQERGTKLPPASLKWLNTVANTIVSGLFAGSRFRDSSSQPPPASTSPPHCHEEQDNTGISGISNINAPGWRDMLSCNPANHDFSDGFWSTSRPIASENCNYVHNLGEDFNKRASYSNRQVIENTIPSKQNISEANLPSTKSELIAEYDSLPSGRIDPDSVQTDPSLLPHPDAARPHTLSSSSSDGHVQYEGLLARMDQLGIHYQLRHHASIMTVDQLMENVGDMPGLHMKNLFLRDKKKKTLYLVCARHNAKVQLNKVGKQVGCRELRFTDRNVLYSVLGVEPGHVTAYALINDVRNVVTLVLDEAVTYDKQQMVNFHPLVNTATLGVSSRDLLSFIEFTRHKPLLMKFEDA